MPVRPVGHYEIGQDGFAHFITPEQMETRRREFTRTGKQFHLGEVPRTPRPQPVQQKKKQETPQPEYRDEQGQGISISPSLLTQEERTTRIIRTSPRVTRGVVATSNGKPVTAKDIINFSKRAPTRPQYPHAPFLIKEAGRKSRIRTKMFEFEKEQKRKQKIINEVAESPQIKSVVLARDLGMGVAMTEASGALEAAISGKDVMKTINIRLTELKRSTAEHFLKEHDDTKLIGVTAAEAGLTTGLILAGGGAMGKIAQKGAELGYVGMSGLQAIKTATEPSIRNIADTIVMSAPLAIGGIAKGTKFMRERISPPKLDVSLSDIKGFSITKEKKMNDYIVRSSEGRFEAKTKRGIIKGKTKSASASDSLTTLTDTKIEIPEQTISGIEVKKQTVKLKSITPRSQDKTMISRGSDIAVNLELGEPTDIAINRISNGKRITEHKLGQKGLGRILSGPLRTESKLKLISEKPTRKGGGTIRRYKGKSVGVRFKESDIDIVFTQPTKEGTYPLIRVKDTLRKPEKVELADIDWKDITVDIDKYKNTRRPDTFGGTGAKRTKSRGTRQTTKVKEIPKQEIKSVPDVPSRMSLKIEPVEISKSQPVTIPLMDYALDVGRKSARKTRPMQDTSLNFAHGNKMNNKIASKGLPLSVPLVDMARNKTTRDVNLVDVISINGVENDRRTPIGRQNISQTTKTIKRITIDVDIPQMPPIHPIRTEKPNIPLLPPSLNMDLSFSLGSVTRKKTKTVVVKNPLDKKIFKTIDISLKGIV